MKFMKIYEWPNDKTHKPHPGKQLITNRRQAQCIFGLFFGGYVLCVQSEIKMRKEEKKNNSNNKREIIFYKFVYWNVLVVLVGKMNYLLTTTKPFIVCWNERTQQPQPTASLHIFRPCCVCMSVHRDTAAFVYFN